LRICEDKNVEYGLGLKIPTASEFKALVRSGVRVSPMEYFFEAVGFSKAFSKKANLQYQNIFMRDYPPVPFSGVHATLRALHDAGLVMGIVTSNVKTNVVTPLGESIDLFRSDCVYSKDTMASFSKADAIVSVLGKLEIDPDETIYVGDQYADWEAAQKACVNFLGVAYGWGISEEDLDFPVVETTSEICDYILSAF
jgi:phosphoglycolate phosphatase-like HAD superfamily hydrolase